MPQDGQAGVREIPVPSCWEETVGDYEGVAWYQRDFTVPAEWKDCHVRLRFGAVNYLAEVWVNGQPAGCHEGGFSPFDLDVTGLLEYGSSNGLVVRVVGPAIREERIAGLVRDEAPHWRGAYVGGIWQSVRLTASDPVYVADVFVEPRLGQKRASVFVEAANQGLMATEADLSVSIAPAGQPDQPVAREGWKGTIPPGGQTIALTLPIDSPVPWSPDRPHLYAAIVRIETGGKCLDEVSARFGMREFTVRDGDFHLNGRKIFIKGAFWEGMYPATLAHPRDPEIVRREIRLAREAGFNLLRPWRHPTPELICDLCDEMGMLLIGSPAIECMGYWPTETPRLESRWTSEMVEMVRRDRNHPSIICWETSNEIIRKSLLLLRHRVSLAARRADPTRLIIDESGGTRAPWGAHAYLPYSSQPVPIDDRHIYLRSPVSDGDYRRLLTYGQADRLTFVSEVGYGGAPDLPRNLELYKQRGNPNTPDWRYHHELADSLQKLLAEHDLAEVFPDVSAFCRATQALQAEGNKLQLEALRLNPACDGYCLHAYTDGDWVLGAGVLDVWREPKRVYATVTEVQRPLYLAIHTRCRNVYAERGLDLTITAVNDGPAVKGELVVTLKDAAGREAWTERKAVRVDSGIARLFERKVETRSLSGPAAVEARLVGGDMALAENTFSLLIFPSADLKLPADRPVVIIDRKNLLRKHLASQGVTCRAFGQGGEPTGPVLVAAPDAWNEEDLDRFVRLMDWVRRGGVAVWLTAPSKVEWHGQPISRDWQNNYMLQLQRPEPARKDPPQWLIETGVFPLDLRQRYARGHWIPVAHYMRKHPIFAGLPGGACMGQEYQNVAPANTLVNLPGRAIAGSVSWDTSFDCYAKMTAWHGVDLAEAPCGKGRMVLSMLQIVENLGSDPLADRLLRNLLEYATGLVGPVDPPGDGIERDIQRYRRKYAELKRETGAAGK